MAMRIVGKWREDGSDGKDGLDGLGWACHVVRYRRSWGSCHWDSGNRLRCAVVCHCVRSATAYGNVARGEPWQGHVLTSRRPGESVLNYLISPEDAGVGLGSGVDAEWRAYQISGEVGLSGRAEAYVR